MKVNNMKSRVKHESDLRNMFQQYETQIINLLQKHQQQTVEFEATVQAKHNENGSFDKTTLIPKFRTKFIHHTTITTAKPHLPTLHPYVATQTTQPQYMNHAIFNMLNQSLLQQAQASKEHFLSSAKIWDGTSQKNLSLG